MSMSTTTVTTERQDIHKIIDTLSDSAVKKLIEHAKLLRDEQEIAALNAKYGTTPNAETIAAMMEAESGGGEEFSSIEELMADLHDENDD
jgi:hypothetical protein